MEGIKNLKINSAMFSDPNVSFKLNHTMVGTKIVVQSEETNKEEDTENKDNNDMRRTK